MCFWLLSPHKSCFAHKKFVGLCFYLFIFFGGVGGLILIFSVKSADRTLPAELNLYITSIVHFDEDLF